MKRELAEVSALIDLMVKKKVLIAKVDGIELTLHPMALQDPLPDVEPKKKVGDPEIDDAGVNPLRKGLRELAAEDEKLNGQEVEPDFEFAHTEGGEEPFE